MPNTNHKDDATRLPMNPKRRSFMTHTLMGGLATALVAAQPTRAVQTPVEGCGQPSAADWLVIGLTWVNQIISDAYAKNTAKTRKKLASCSKAFEQLYGLLDELCKELGRTSKLTAQVKQMRDLAEVGRANANLMKTDLAHGNAQPLIATLAVVSQQVCLQAQDLPAGAELKLSREATDILRRILEIVQSEDFKNLHTRLTTVQTEDADPTEIISQLVGNIQQNILNARTSIIRAENPDPRNEEGEVIRINRPYEWKRADDNLKAALTQIQTLIKEYQVETILPADFIAKLPANVLSESLVRDSLSGISVDNRLTAADTLSMGLGKVRREIRTPQNGFPASSHHGVARGKESYSTPSQVDRNRIGELLWRYCPPGSRDQIDKCDSIVSFVNGWDPFIPQTARQVLINSALYWGEKFNRITCSGTRNFKVLAQKLAELV